jgi:hypothetical protein
MQLSLKKYLKKARTLNPQKDRTEEKQKEKKHTK